MKEWIDRFKDPTPEYRPHPFWSWNDKLDENELRRQIIQMAEIGDGGFFMHARDGLRTPYMEGDWFDMVRACVDEAEKQGVHAWCYDELGWPSGSAGGAVPAMSEEYKLRWIRFREFKGSTDGDVIAFYSVKDSLSYRYLGDSVIDAEIAVQNGENVMYATQFTDDGYFDILNRRAVRAFIEHTYDAYDRESNGELNGGALHGFFTDEPQYALCRTPWSTVLEDEFLHAYGYTLKEHIPGLFLGRDGHEKLRYDFWKLINRLYTESFAKQIYDWCEEHGCQLTGHAMMEDNLLCQIHCTGGCMPMYEYMHVPGIDWLGHATSPDRLSGDSGNPLIPLQVGSVAAQLGKKHVITETYAMSGWDISFAEMRHLVEWQFLGGVNLVCQHLSAYTLRGHRKNDYPPCIFYQSPWWDEYKVFCDTIARIGKILADGENDPGVLMVHPMHSIWLKYTNDDLNAEGAFDDIFTNTVMCFAQAHLPFHLGDETIISRHGRVEGNSFIIGERSYHTVFVPNIMGLDRTTYELLLKFAENGGRIALLGDSPKYIDGLYAEEELKLLTDKCDKIVLHENGACFENLMSYISEKSLDRIPITGSDGEAKYIQVCVRKYRDDGKNVYFFVNMSRELSQHVSITLNESSALLLSPDTMMTEKLKTRHHNGKTVIDLTFAPLESRMIVAGEGLTADICPESLSAEVQLDVCTSEWRIGDASSPNCCLLEYCRVGDGSEWSEKVHTMKLSEILNCEKFKKVSPRVKYEFTVADTVSLENLCDMRFVTEVELPASVYINGVKAELLEGEWWLDHMFSVFSIGSHIKHGVNQIVLADFCHTEIKETEEIFVPNSPFTFGYLIGSFGVYSETEFLSLDSRAVTTSGPFYIAEMPKTICGGNIVPQGFPFFAGKMILEKDIQIDYPDIPHHITLDSLSAAYARISINGKRGRLLAWGDMRDDITDRVCEGDNTLSIEICISNRNLLGPHHIKESGRRNSGPSDFIPSADKREWMERYTFVKAGIGE